MKNTAYQQKSHRINKGNRVYYAYHRLMTCKLIKHHTKRKIYMMLICQ